MAESRPILALDLSNDGISLWHRSGAGWDALGQIPLDSPDLSMKIRELRAKAGITHKKPVKTVVRIPRSEVMISRLKLGIFEGDAALSQARRLIADLTPYPLDEVVYDLERRGVGNMAPVAIAAIATLQEADFFAAQHGFKAVYFTTHHGAREFPREPRFYLTPPKKPLIHIVSRVAAALAVGVVVGYFGWANFREPSTETIGPVGDLTKAEPAIVKAAPKPEKVTAAPKPKPEAVPELQLPPEFSPPQTATLLAPKTTEYPQLVIGDIGRTSLRHITRLARPGQQKGAQPPVFQATTTNHKTDALALAEAHRDLPDLALDDDVLTRYQAEMAMDLFPEHTAEAAVSMAAFTPPNIAYDQIIESLLNVPVPAYQNPPLDATKPADPPPPPPAPVIAEPGTLIPTPEGTLGPENILIFSGRPPILPRQRADLTPPPNPLARFRPRARPAGLVPLDLLSSFEGPENPAQPIAPNSQDPQPDAPVQTTAPRPQIVAALQIAPPQAPVAFAPVGPPALPAQTVLALADPALAGFKARARPAGLVPITPLEPETTPAAQAQAEPQSILALADPALAGIKARARPANLVPVQPALQEPATLLAAADPALAGKRARARPANLNTVAPVIPQGLLARADPALAVFRAKKRPRSLKIITPQIEQPEATPEAIPSENTLNSATRLAVAKSRKPQKRPENIAKIAARSVNGDTRATAKTPSSAIGSSKPSPGSTTVTVAKAATERSKFNKKKMSLVGVFGTPSSRRALVRLPSGRYIKVKTGDRLSGWQVSAIGESTVRIRKGSKNQTLRMP